MKLRTGFYTYFFTALIGTAFTLSGCGGGGGSPVVSKPIAPIGVSAVAGDGTVMLGWSTVASATSYNVYRSLSSGVSGTMITSGLSSTSYQDPGLANGTTYYYAITAVNSAGASAVSSQVSAAPVAGTPGTITITGKIHYQDKEYGVNGFTGNQPYKAVRYASVELVSAASGGVLSSALTDTTGSYSIISSSSTTLTLYVRVNSEATLTGNNPQIEVKDLSGNIYAVRGDDFTPSGPANVDISIPTTSVGGAFNMLDVFTSGYRFVYSLAGAYPPVTLSGYWQTGNLNGTYYCSGGCSLPGEGIYVLNDPSGDTDEYDDDVLYHEFGHFTAAHFSRDESPGGQHGFVNNDLDMRLAWSEGWGDSFPGAIKLWLSATSQQDLISSASGVSLTEYVDTIGNSGFSLDMGNPGALPYFYACNEVAVAKILLDLNKDFAMQDVWAVITDFQTHPPAIPVNLELFWDRWHSLSEPSTSPATAITIDSIFSNRLIYYSTNNNVVSASTYTVNMTGKQNHTISGDGNVDLVSFNTSTGQHYTITTSTLINGADTFITLLNSDQTTTTPNTSPANPNDNANGTTYSGINNSITLPNVPSDVYYSLLCDAYGICHENGFDILASKLTFTASSTGPYYVKIQSSPARPVSAGRYGSYSLTITSP